MVCVCVCMCVCVYAGMCALMWAVCECMCANVHASVCVCVKQHPSNTYAFHSLAHVWRTQHVHHFQNPFTYKCVRVGIYACIYKGVTWLRQERGENRVRECVWMYGGGFWANARAFVRACVCARARVCVCRWVFVCVCFCFVCVCVCVVTI